MRGLPEHFNDLVQEVAEKSFTKHALQLGEFDNPLLGPPLQIENAAQLARHVRYVLLNPLSVAAKLSENRVVCYDRYSNTLVLLTPDAKKPGTCYRPDADGTTLQKILEDSRAPAGGKCPRALLGGLYALFPEWRGRLQITEEKPAAQTQLSSGKLD